MPKYVERSMILANCLQSLFRYKTLRFFFFQTSLRNGVCIPVSMSHSSSTTSMPICRICQLPSMEPNNPLLSPCRCLGSIRYVHNPCLKVSSLAFFYQSYCCNLHFYFEQKWLEVSSKKNSDPPGCELCQYPYIRHKPCMVSLANYVCILLRKHSLDQ